MDPKETGIVVISIGMSVFLMGAVLLMDRALMVSGNLLIVIGLVFLVRSRMISLLHQDKLQGSITLGLGVLFLVYGFPMFGFLLEVFGLFLLLRDSVPTFRSVLKNLLFGKLGRFVK